MIILIVLNLMSGCLSTEDKNNFAWSEQTRKVSEEKCARVKRYARMGIANVNNPYDAREALAFEPDIVDV